MRERAWDDFPGDRRDPSWHRLPGQYTGDPADVLRQLEHDLVDGETSVVHRSGRLVLAQHDERGGGTTYREYELVEPGFLEEFQAVAEAEPIDLQKTVPDPLVGRFVASVVADMFTPAREPGEHVRQLMSLLLWMFMMGREHAVRGYDEPPAGESDEATRQMIRDVFEREDPAESWTTLTREKTGFAAEFSEVAEDTFLDYRYTLLDVDEEAGRHVDEIVVELVRRSGRDPETLVAHLLSAARWMFLLGRAHARHGYPAPVNRGDDETL